MHTQSMTNAKGMKSANNYLIQDNRGVIFLQSYNEIVCIKKKSIIYAKETGFDRSKTTNKFMNLFIERFTDGEVIVLLDKVFNEMERSL